MLGRATFPALVAAALIPLIPVTLAIKIIPCKYGSGSENGCGNCEPSLAIDVPAWNKAKVGTFNMDSAVAPSGGGWDVYWNIPKPDKDCRVVLFDPYKEPYGNMNPSLVGNTILSTGLGGCIYGHVSSRGIAAGFCCGEGDCDTASANIGKRKRSVPLSRAVRTIDPSSPEREPRDLTSRGWGGKPDPKPVVPSITCTKAVKVGEGRTMYGKQQIDGASVSCNGGAGCDFSRGMTVMKASTLTSEKSTTLTTSEGVSVSVTAGYAWGPTLTVTGGYNKDWSDAVTNGMSTADTTTVSDSVTVSLGLMPGVSFNMWFTPYMNCQTYSMKCNDVEMSLDKCDMSTDPVSHQASGDTGVIAIG